MLSGEESLAGRPRTPAEQLIAQSLAQQQITRGQLTLHADRGSTMRSKPVAFLLADLGVTEAAR